MESCESISATIERPHTLTPFAVVDGMSITYPRSALDARQVDSSEP